MPLVPRCGCAAAVSQAAALYYLASASSSNAHKTLVQTLRRGSRLSGVAHLQEECARYLTGRAYKRSKRKKGMSAVPMSLGERMRSPVGWFLCLRVVPSGATAAVLAVA